MKFIVSQMMLLATRRSNRRNLLFVLKFLIGLTVLVALYSVIFHVIMEHEQRDYSPVTGLYWTLTVMSTLGFGDITFISDPGKIFTIIVLLTGILCFMLMLPFTFIRYIYSPFLDAQSSSITPRRLDADTKDHVIIVGADENAQSIAWHLGKYGYNYVMLLPDTQQALTLYDAGFKVVIGDVDVPATYTRIQAPQAAMIIALSDDMKNTNIASTVREAQSDAPLVARIMNPDSRDILQLAGADHVFNFSQMLGAFLARRVFDRKNCTNIISDFEGFSIAEAPAANTSMAGKTLRDSNLRARFGLNLAGIWQGNDYMVCKPETVIDDGAVLLLAGTRENLQRYDSVASKEQPQIDTPVLILGGGTVGKSVAESLAARQIPCRIVEKNPGTIPPGDRRYILGSAADRGILRTAGIDSTQTVLVTTHDDDVNIYLTIYCRKLRPEIQIISRANLDRNVASLYSAGANLVVSLANMMATAIINLLTPGRVFMLTEGLNIFKVRVPEKLAGHSLAGSKIREQYQCNVIAVQTSRGIIVPPEPDEPLAHNDELILIGTARAEDAFMRMLAEH